MKLEIQEVFSHREIMHYADAELRISSHSNVLYLEEGKRHTDIKLPNSGWKAILGRSRVSRRALRLDKCNAVPVGRDLVAIRQGVVYHYDGQTGALTPTLRLRQCRSVLHQSITVTNDRQIYFGEYGQNRGRGPVPVYRSRDGGRSWEVAHEFAAGEVRHVHGCFWDPYEHKIWVLTGDLDGECRIMVTDAEFESLEHIGDGRQAYRTCNMFFERDTVHWIMDSQFEDNYHIKLDRSSRRVSKHDLFPGPVWYIKRLSDGFYVAGTAQERGPGVHDGYSHLMASRDLESWSSVHRFEHDGLPKSFFKFGVVGFADGTQSSDGFYIFCEAIKGLDGKVALCRLTT